MKNIFQLSTCVFLTICCLSFSACQEKGSLIDFSDPLAVRSQKPLLIAHRGGVISDKSPECSLAAIELADQEGYEMVELDIQKSKDGVPMVFHDRDMSKACGIDRRIRDMSADEIVNIKFLNTDQMICTFDQVLDLCQSLNLGIMLDVKVEDDEEFFMRIASILKKHAFENSCVTINRDTLLLQHLKEISLLLVTQEEFEKVQQGQPCELQNKFWFGLPEQLPSNMVEPLQKCGAYVIPAINRFRYPEEGHYIMAQKDIQRLTKAGVDGFQIDCIYQDLFERPGIRVVN